jgi:IS5 family transposase
MRYHYQNQKRDHHKMREKSKKQLPLMHLTPDHPQARELECISRILDAEATTTDWVHQDLCRGRELRDTGANGMSAEQVLRAAIVKQMFGYSYELLPFHLMDSITLRAFCRIGIADKGFKRSAIAKNIKRISPATWEQINRVLVHHGKEQKVEKGRQARFDCTVVESNIHAPTDATLLFDGIRVLARILEAIRQHGVQVLFTDHCRRAKRRLLAVQYAKKEGQRKTAYRDLLKLAHKTVGYATAAIPLAKNQAGLEGWALGVELERYVALSRQVIEQTERRVLKGEKVPAAEKIVSIFEPHTDIIVKDRRDTYYGHKVCLCVGVSNLITDCVITEGNPADTELTLKMLDRQQEIYGRYPLKVALDGGFASKKNLAAAKERQIKDVCFAKKRGLQVEEMCRSQWVYNRLRRFRAGVESVISWIKRCLGFDRCTWKGRRSFESYVWLSAVTANLITLARAEAA